MEVPYLSEKPSSDSIEKVRADLTNVVSGQPLYQALIIAHSGLQQNALASDIQAVPADLLEAEEYAQTMNKTEIAAIIHRIVEEVRASRYLPCLNNLNISPAARR